MKKIKMSLFKYTTKKAFKDLEKTMVKNIANTLLQIAFHANGTEKELSDYYGWEEDTLKTEERQKLIKDSMRRLESEKIILEFIKNNKKTLHIYANENDKGSFDSIIQRSTGASAEQTSGSVNAGDTDERGPEEGTNDDTGHGNDANKEDNSRNKTTGDEGGTKDGRNETASVQGNDTSRNASPNW